MSALSLLGAFGTLLVTGYGLLALLVGQKTRFSLTEQIAFSWLLGIGSVSLLLWIFGLLSMGACYRVSLVSFVFHSDSLVGDEWCQSRVGAGRRLSKFFSG